MSTEITRYQRYTVSFVYDYATLDGKVEGDISEVIWSLQTGPQDADSAVMTKTLGSGITIDDSTKTFSVSIGVGDYDNVKLNKEYFQIFGIKYTGDTRFREFRLKNSSNTSLNATIKVVQNWLEL